MNALGISNKEIQQYLQCDNDIKIKSIDIKLINLELLIQRKYEKDFVEDAKKPKFQFIALYAAFVLLT